MPTFASRVADSKVSHVDAPLLDLLGERVREPLPRGRVVELEQPAFGAAILLVNDRIASRPEFSRRLTAKRQRGQLPRKEVLVLRSVAICQLNQADQNGIGVGSVGEQRRQPAQEGVAVRQRLRRFRDHAVEPAHRHGDDMNHLVARKMRQEKARKPPRRGVCADMDGDRPDSLLGAEQLKRRGQQPEIGAVDEFRQGPALDRLQVVHAEPAERAIGIGNAQVSVDVDKDVAYAKCVADEAVRLVQHIRPRMKRQVEMV